MQSTISEFDLYLLAEGTHYRAYEKLGAHIAEKDGKRGVQFAVWAPNAKSVSIIGDFNNWNPHTVPMRPSTAGIWEGFVPEYRSRRQLQISHRIALSRLQSRQGGSLRLRVGNSSANGIARLESRKLFLA